MIFLRVIDVQRNQQERQNDSRNNTADKHCGNRNRAGCNSVNNEDVARRNNGGKNGAGCGDGGGISAVIALFGHHLDFDGAQTDRVRVRCAADAAKQHAGQNIGVCQTTAEVAAERVTEKENALCNAAAAHQIGRQNKEGNTQEGKRVYAADHFHRQNREGDITEEKGQQADARNAPANRHANNHKRDKDN